MANYKGLPYFPECALRSVVVNAPVVHAVCNIDPNEPANMVDLLVFE